MDTGDRTFSMSKIQEEREQTERQFALIQRRLEALRKMAEGAEELEAAEREMASGAAPQADTTIAQQPAPVSLDPGRPGDRAKLILRRADGQFITPRQVCDEMVRRGWLVPTKDARASVRVLLKRLEARDDEIERIDTPPTHSYRWRPGN